MTVLGIDIGGSGIKGAPVNVKTGEFLEERYRIPTPSPGKPEQVIEVIKQIVDHFNWEGKIGAGFPGVVRRGVIGTAANVSKDWIGQNLAKLIKDATGSKTTILNDADAAGLAEMRFGSGKKYEDEFVLFLTIGTGIGSALFVKRELWPNSELGHLNIRGKDAERIAGDGVRSEKNLSWKKWGKRLDKVLQTYEFLLNPDVIILGGGVSNKFDNYGKYLKNIEAEVIPAVLRNQAGIVGAAMAAAESIIID
ncbi:MAG: ROK family protein [Brevefilum sp.]|nr:ROK family protein [Brevefilum sp.]MDT8380876.1 ROK family protein [Brevefilum sp.]MDW7754874.1 ROK family protein [Brevefilum sp.]